MKTNILAAAVCALELLAAAPAVGAVRYVNLNNLTPAPPYTAWASAATNIQDAIDAAGGGDEIVVTNGVYQTGGRVVNGAMTNRVAVTKPLKVRSMNGPAVTVIQGYQVTDTTNGDSAVRCVYLGEGAALVGFTLTNGATRRSYDFEWARSGGGVWCAAGAEVSYCVLSGNSASGYPGGGGAYGGTLNNCTFSDNSAIEDEVNAGWGGGASSSTLNNCTLTRNSAINGGGAFQGVLNNCTITSNSAFNGGGASTCTLSNCTLTGNSVIAWGGGAIESTLDNCRLTANSAPYGGGASESSLNNCVLTGNSAYDGGGQGGISGVGGGAIYGTLNNCTLTGNSAHFGGGAAGGLFGECILNNCTLTGNSATFGGAAALTCRLNNCTLSGNTGEQGGGVYSGRFGSPTLNNCIAYLNAGGNYYGGLMNYCCTTPLPTNGFGNFTNAPVFTDQVTGDFRLHSNSPCINGGFNGYAPLGFDLGGNPRIVGGTVDVGAYEFPSPGSLISYAWLQQFGLPTDGSADQADPDGDRLTNWQEWRCLTDPTNALSVLRLLSPASGVPGVAVRWQSVTNRTYFLERSTNLGVAPAFGTLASNLIGQAGTTVYADTNAVGTGPYFYRVGVE